MFDGFESTVMRVGDADLAVLTGGSGAPLLLLHGYPQTRAIWHLVAPRLADRFALVIPDLPGYGRSRGPEPDADNVNYSKRTTARTLAAMMAELGHGQFSLAGHDRGGRVAYRMCLDQPERIVAAAFLDIVPTLDVWEEMNWTAALEGYHWPLLAQPSPLPERLIGADPDFYVEHLLSRWAGDRLALDDRAVADYRGQFHRAGVLAATCADYRAGATIDMEHDRADRDAGRRIACPCLALWARGYHSTRSGGQLEVWRRWADDVREVSLDCGHFVAEERPQECAAALAEFFGAQSSGQRGRTTQ
jgi:haloacetate dehalogenase